MKTLVIIPAYNEASNIVRVIEHLKDVAPNFDFVIINDGSKDKTAQICKDNSYNLIDLPVNLGLAGAVQAGMQYALTSGYDAALQFDADGQHKAEYIEDMAKKLCEGYHIVIGSRFVTTKKPFSLRMIGSFLISFAIRITTGKKLTDPTSGMRMYNREMIEQLALEINHTPEPDTVSYLIKRGAKVVEVPVEMDERIAGESYLNLSRSIFYMLRMALSIMLVQPFRGKTKVKEPLVYSYKINKGEA